MDSNTAGTNTRGIAFAVLAAALYAVSAPFSKLLLAEMPSTLMAGFLYLGAGVGMGLVALAQRLMGRKNREEPITGRELPFVLAMILLDIAAPICLLMGLSMTTAANASLLNNFEIVATALIALAVFGERIGGRLWWGIAFVTLSCMLLSFEGADALRLSRGSLLVLLACVCWGVENNCTRRLSVKDPQQIVILKGVFSGAGSLVIGLCLGERMGAWWSLPAVLAVGFVAYGMSIFFYVSAQRILGAARTGAYYAVAPFIGTLLSLAIFGEAPSPMYFAALGLMVVGAWLSSGDQPIRKRKKDRVEKEKKT